MYRPERALDRAFPPLRALPRLPLGSYPTPVETLDLQALVPGFGGRAWVKREDLSSEEVGGNKVRKLEFLLGAARSRGASAVVTLGGVGSNHCLATAYHAAEASLETHLAIFPHHATAASRRTLRAICALGPRISVAPGPDTAVVLAASVYTRLAASGKRPYAILPGGSSATGVLGFVDAGLELAEQVAAGQLEPPDAVFLAYGSGGSAAGLALGLRLAGLKPEVVAVRVYPLPATSRTWLGILARRALRRLSAATGEELPTTGDLRLRVAGEHLGAGYAEPTAEGTAAREAAEELGLVLEPTYTAKTFAALLDAAASRKYREGRLLFIQTYGSRLPEGLACDVAPGLIPDRLRAYA